MTLSFLTDSPPSLPYEEGFISSNILKDLDEEKSIAISSGDRQVKRGIVYRAISGNVNTMTLCIDNGQYKSLVFDCARQIAGILKRHTLVGTGWFRRDLPRDI